MSIILKGIDKSKYARTFRIYPSGKVLELNDEGLLDNENPYQAIQIPTPHGRLIDASTETTVKSMSGTAMDVGMLLIALKQYVPTIFESED